MDGQTRTYLVGSDTCAIGRRTAPIALDSLEVLVHITHSGVCGTDSHDRVASCGLGHEGVGTVERVGSAVTAVQVGQRVGCSWQIKSCGTCTECITGYRHYCAQSVGQKYGAAVDHGTFCDYAIRHQDYVNPIPDGLASEHAGPLICAGITVFEGLVAAETQPTDRVGIVGLGGLGHLAVMYARAMGCDVVVFSGNDSKRDDAMKLGATEFQVLNTAGTAEGQTPPPPVAANVNVLLLCGGDITDLSIFLPLLARRGRIVPLVIQHKPVSFPYMAFTLPGHKIIASLGATRHNEQEALRFAVRHQIKPWIQEFPMSADGLTRALKALDDGAVRYRAVLSKELGNEFSA